ncbi:EAL and HDOD domain-containing protein [Roseateles terrae]|uniref:EAL domain-containing protein (Putative c-di-GMP-specific phosphodiesterase class I) n=1 Tax=Roseateles terrae TaxID=431060 RepID=A0ABR6GPD5_9BURK|nr:EAL domain-containing protein [Roseateles terrae]MBB3193048.1 EAL domain-containing protein (putative c-di-GMP-specific phosphodiesterase class I) [Roseateles terrae]
MWKEEFSRSARQLPSSLASAAANTHNDTNTNASTDIVTDIDCTPVMPLLQPHAASISLAVSVSVNPSICVSATHAPLHANTVDRAVSTSPLGLPPSCRSQVSTSPPSERRGRAALLAYGAVAHPRSVARPVPSAAADLRRAPVANAADTGAAAGVCSRSAPAIPAADREHATAHLRFALQPIVDVSGRRVGHELLFRWNSSDQPVMPTLGAYATASALCHALIDGQLLTGGSEEPVGTLYVNMDERFLLSPMAEVMTPDLGVIEILETIVPTAEVQRRVQDLHRRGYRFSLDDVETTEDPRWVLAEYVESVKIDVQAVRPGALVPLISMARAAGLTVVAEKVETPEVIAELSALGVRLFQGYAVQRPMVRSVPALPGCHSRTLGLMQQLAAQGMAAEALSVIAESDPALVARLLRLQALHAPHQALLSRDLAQVIDSLPRPVLTGWLTQWLIAAQHVRGQEAVARLSRELAADRAQLLAAGPTEAAERREQLFSRYRYRVQTF